MHSIEVSIASKGLWIGFLIGVFVLLLLDLVLFRSTAKKVTPQHGVLESLFWIATALLFNAVFAWTHGTVAGIEFLTAYVVEKSLSIDNLFIILLIFDSLQIPHQYRYRVLFYGVLGAI